VSANPHLSLLKKSVLWIRNFLLRIRIRLFKELRIRIRLSKSSEPNIYSFSRNIILRSFNSILKHNFQRILKLRNSSFFYGFYACFHPVLNSDPDPTPQVTDPEKVSDPCGSGSTTLGKILTKKNL
jgi:hypothetical protein